MGGKKTLSDRVRFSTLYLAVAPFHFCYIQKEGLIEGGERQELRRQKGSKSLLGSVLDKDVPARKGGKAT